MINRTFIKYVGFKYTLNSRSLIIQLISMTKENQQLTDDKIKSFIKATSKYFDQITKKENLQELFGDLNFVTEESTDYNEPFYKFIHRETYDNYISKGKHRLGSLKYYREIEKDESRDEKEGFSNLIINSGKRQIFTSVISGFDKYILCGTSNLDEQKYMSQNFGCYVLKIRNINSFAEKIKKAIGAIDWQVRKVRYSDYKAYMTDSLIMDLNGVSPDLSDEMFDILYNISETPSVFCKPERFSPEQELRLAFFMGRDVKKILEFDNKGLLDDIEVFKI
jgi:hypothetical protein